MPIHTPARRHAHTCSCHTSHPQTQQLHVTPSRPNITHRSHRPGAVPCRAQRLPRRAGEQRSDRAAACAPPRERAEPPPPAGSRSSAGSPGARPNHAYLGPTTHSLLVNLRKPPLLKLSLTANVHLKIPQWYVTGRHHP